MIYLKCVKQKTHISRKLKQNDLYKKKNSDFIIHLTSKMMDTTLPTERSGEEMERSGENKGEIEKEWETFTGVEV